MTVGIAAVCESEQNQPRIILAADRLVTTGMAARIEYEHTNSKMETVFVEDEITVMGVAAGSLSLADDMFYKIGGYIDNNSISSVREIVEYGVDSYHDMLKETIERQVLKPNGFTRESFNNRQQQLNPQIAQGIYQDMLEIQNKVESSLNILIAGVDDSGAHIYSIQGGDMARFDSIGYHCVGMGAEPANSAFIRTRYNDECSVDDALLAVVDAKIQSERAQGVGREMDISVLSRGNIDQCEDIGELRDIHEDVSDAEQEARGSVLDEKDYNFDS